MNRTNVWRPGAIILTLGALLLLTLLLLLGSTRADFVRVDASSYVDVQTVCPNRIEFGLALADGDGDELDAIYQAYYVDKTPAISLTIVVTATGAELPTPLATSFITLPRIPEPPLVISYSPGVTPATYLYARTDLQPDSAQYVTGTLPLNGNIVITWDQALISGTEIVLGISSSDPISAPFQAFTYPQTGTLLVDACTIKAYLPIVKGKEPNRPFPPSNPDPADGAVDQALALDLTWEGGDALGSAITYDVLLEAGNPTPAGLTCDGITSTLCATGPLSPETRYYWQVIAQNPQGVTNEGPVWMFMTGATALPPVEPANPTPADRAEEQPANLVLTWEGNAPSYDVYLDESNPKPTTLACEDVKETACNIGPLEFESDYYWRVVAHYGDGLDTESPVWRFYTVSKGWAVMVAEDFEGTFPETSKWIVGDKNEHPGVYQWAKSDCRAYQSDHSGWGVGDGDDGANLDCGDEYPSNAESWMIHGPFSLSDAQEAELVYKAWLNTDSDWDSVCHMASTNGVNFSGSCSTTASPQRTWTERKLDLSNVNNLGDLRGEHKVWIAFIFESDEGGVKPEGGYIDDVIMRQYVDIEEVSTAAPAAAESMPAGDRPATFTLER